MAETQSSFKGMEFVKESTFTATTFTALTNVLYFVRTDNPTDKKTDGYLYFNGKKYGTGADAITKLKSLYGDLKVDDKDVTIETYVTTKLESVAQSIDAAVNALNAPTVGEKGKFIQSIAEENGKISAVAVDLSAANVSSAAVTGDDSKVAVLSGTVQSAVESLATSIKTVEKAAGEKIKSVSGSNAITVNTNDNAAAVSLKLAEGDKAGNVVLSQNEDGLKAQLDADKIVKIADTDKVLSFSDGALSAGLSLIYNSTDKKIYLYGKDSTSADKAISTIDASDFIKDGMLESAGFDKNNNILTLTFNTDSGKDAIPIDLSSLVDTYKAGEGLVLANDGTFSIDTTKIATLEKVNTAVNKEIADAKNRETDIFNRATAYTETKTNSILGTSEDTAEKATVYGAKAYTDAKVKELEGEIEANAITLEVPDTDKYISGVSGKTEAGGIKFTISSNETAITNAITTKIAELDATVSGESNGVKVTVEETDGKLTGVTVEAPDFANTYATLENFNAFTGRTDGFATSAQGQCADSAVQKVNGVTGTSVTIDASIIQAKIGTDEGSTAYTSNVNTVLADIYGKIGAVKVTSKNTITVTDGRNIEVNLEPTSEEVVKYGHIQITYDTNGLYGVMYCTGDDVE